MKTRAELEEAPAPVICVGSGDCWLWEGGRSSYAKQANAKWRRAATRVVDFLVSETVTKPVPTVPEPCHKRGAV